MTGRNRKLVPDSRSLVRERALTTGLVRKYGILNTRVSAENRENTTVSAAILCSAVCVSDVVNKGGTCGKSMKYVTNQSFLFCSSLVKSEPKWPRPKEPKIEAKKYFIPIHFSRTSIITYH